MTLTGLGVLELGRHVGEPPSLCSECRLGSSLVYGPTLAANAIEIFSRRASVEFVPPQRTFLREGEIPASVFSLYSGWAFQYRRLQNGRRQILNFLVPGDTLPLEQLYLPGSKMGYAVQSLTELRLCAFDPHSLSELLLRRPNQQEALAMAFTDRLSSMNQRLVDLGRRSAVGRLAQFLVQLEVRLRERRLSVDGSFLFPVSQEHIADALGLTTVYVNRLLHRLRREKIVTFDRRTMRIMDLDRLKGLMEDP